MENEIKALIAHVVIMIVILIVISCICITANKDYNMKKNSIQQYNNVVVDIKNNDSKMYVNVNNYNKDKKIINLILKTSKFSNEYKIGLDDSEYNLNMVPRTEDGEHYYFNLGSYEVIKTKSIKFSMDLVGDNVYDDSITYSFVAEVANC